MEKAPSGDRQASEHSVSARCLQAGEVGISLEGGFIHHDQDPVYTGYRWLQALLIDVRAKVSFSENGAKWFVLLDQCQVFS